jgi:Flagellar hook-length control protein FliK
MKVNITSKGAARMYLTSASPAKPACADVSFDSRNSASSRQAECNFLSALTCLTKKITPFSGEIICGAQPACNEGADAPADQEQDTSAGSILAGLFLTPDSTLLFNGGTWPGLPDVLINSRVAIPFYQRADIASADSCLSDVTGKPVLADDTATNPTTAILQIMSSPAQILPHPDTSQSSVQLPRDTLTVPATEMHEACLDQLTEAISLQELSSGKEIRFQLTPKSLGSVTVRLSIEESETKVSFSVDDAKALILMTPLLPRLEKYLENQHNRLATVTLNMATDTNQHNHAPHDERRDFSGDTVQDGNRTTNDSAFGKTVTKKSSDDERFA